MSSTPLVVELPNPLYAALVDRAAQSQRTVQQELVELVSSKLANESTTVENIEEILSGLSTLSDQELWQTASMVFPQDLSERTADLNYKQQRQGLTAGEREELKTMLDYYDRHVLIRSQAITLLKERGHDIGSLLVPPAES